MMIQRILIKLINTFLIISVPLAGYAATLDDSLCQLSGILSAEIFVEDGIGTEYAPSLSNNAYTMAPEDLLEKSLKGFSYGVLYDNNGVSKIWIYKSGKRPFVRISPGKQKNTHMFTNNTSGIYKGADFTPTKKQSRASPSNHVKEIKTGYSGHRYVENSFGYKKPLFNQYSIKQRFRNLKARSNPHQYSASNTGITDYTTRKEQAYVKAALSQSAMMNHRKAHFTRKE